MAQARKLEGGAGAPFGELLPDALEVHEKGTARMGDVRGTQVAQERDGPVGGRRRSRHEAGSFRCSGRHPPAAFAESGRRESTGRVAAQGPAPIIAGGGNPSQSYGFVEIPKL
ncbi:hypothetical protein GCM10010406_26720 [Streptomyces thermolineatus]|uniref:Uncharacterized protein n=1 Tax=Streptomyces thermolineatus TaxID=44033 RepID=A0ABN3LVF5_9ACTN